MRNINLNELIKGKPLIEQIVSVREAVRVNPKILTEPAVLEWVNHTASVVLADDFKFNEVIKKVEEHD